MKGEARVPMFEEATTRAGRLRVFTRAQLPLFGSAAFVVVSTGLVMPEILMSPLFLAGTAVIIVATTAGLMVPWERFPPPWLLAVAFADVVGVAFLRTELLPLVPAAGLLTIFPVLWLAYGFGARMLVACVVSALFIPSFPFVYARSWPADAVAWLNVVTLPALAIGIALVANIASRQLRQRTTQLISAHRTQGEALRRAQDNEILARGIVDAVDAGVVFLDANGDVLLSNQIARDLTELAGIRLDTPPYVGPNVRAADRETFVSLDEQVLSRVFRGEHIDGSLQWWGPASRQVAVVASRSKVRRKDGVPLGTVAVLYDVTELAEAVQVREEFLRTVSHELRTPLTPITGYLDLLQEHLESAPQPDPKSDRLMAIVQRKTHHLAARIAELVSAADSSHDIRPRTIDVTGLVTQLVARHSEPAEARWIELTVAHAADGVTAHLDPRLATQAIDELITNALKFSPAGSSVIVGVQQQDGIVGVFVADEGLGLTVGEQARAFDRFYRSPASRRQAVPGFGLGLALVRSIARAHGGHVHIHSRLGEGTRVTFTVPAGAPAAPRAHLTRA
ncbi:ATP-binding protein [Microbacterium sp. LRZ72]|uniref:sensor histidine kinase n=1 Tax=Microbacterium sp. LRZ72 TaxID=2942481 RepID=UPI0029A128BA|nr:ATP-binding protein [Microbacterium sp. LRZ72]MDX2377847.1 ATP-binding protein [Microbacterium sp. LRZ72]